jgi:putative lipoic acid-binding regulatory protein
MIENMENKKVIDYPAEIIFKAVFRNKPYTMESIKTILHENERNGTVTGKESSGGKFISYTITAVMDSEDQLNKICTEVTMLEGFMSMF